MSQRTAGLLLVVAPLILSATMRAAAAEPPKPSVEVSEARRAGLKLARVVLERLEADDQSKFPGIRAWLEDLRKATRAMDPEKPAEGWPAVDVDALMAHNPNFWRAYYEIAPGDPGL